MSPVIRSQYERYSYPDSERYTFFVRNPNPAMNLPAFEWEYVGSISRYFGFQVANGLYEWGIAVVSPYGVPAYPVVSVSKLRDAVAFVEAQAVAILAGLDRREEDAYHAAQAVVEQVATRVELLG